MVVMVTHRGALLLLSGPEQGCCPPRGPPQPPPVSSMSASQTSPPEDAENRHTMFRTSCHRMSTAHVLYCAHYWNKEEFAYHSDSHDIVASHPVTCTLVGLQVPSPLG